MLAFHSDRFALPLPPGHSFPSSKYGLLREALEAEPDAPWRLVEAEAATEADLARVHTPAYIEAVLQGLLTPAQQREIGFPWSPPMVERSLRSVGATLMAARAAWAEGLAMNLAGGTHHAYADRGSGYCVFNDVAVAARLMQVLHPGLQVLVIDLDVHQGNGTAAIFRDDPSVFTFSMHGAKNFPFRKEASDLDVNLPDGCTDEPYLQALDEAFAEIWRRLDHQAPGLAFYLAGADPHEGDRLGRLKVSTEGLAERDRRVLVELGIRGIPVALSMAGGYGHDLHSTLRVQINTVRAAAAAWSAWPRPGWHAQAVDDCHPDSV